MDKSEDSLVIPASRGTHTISERVRKLLGLGAIMQRHQGHGPYADRDVVTIATASWMHPARVVPADPCIRVMREDGLIRVLVPIDHEAVLLPA